MPRSQSFKLFRNGKQIGTMTMLGKSAKAANAAGRRMLRNIAQGFYDGAGVFHPIRSSSDYSPSRAGERTKKKRKAKRRRVRR